MTPTSDWSTLQSGEIRWYTFKYDGTTRWFIQTSMRSLFYELPMASMSAIWRAIAFGFHIEGWIVIHDTT